MQIEVCEGDAAHSPLNTGDCSNPDCAVATQYEDDAVGFVERIENPCRSRPDHISDSPEVLSPGAGASGSPRNDVRVTEVGHLKSHAAELLNESRVTQCLRTLVLTDPACAGPRGGADDRCLARVRSCHSSVNVEYVARTFGGARVGCEVEHGLGHILGQNANLERRAVAVVFLEFVGLNSV